MSGASYREAGVDIEAGESAVERIKPLVASTRRSGVTSGIGGFGGLFDIAAVGFTDPVLVSSTDGVGTKALVASAGRRFGTIGVDLVAMCVDDLVCQGAEPLFFLDYVSVGELDPDMVEQLVGGVADGCRQAGCALIGGEMAEHPGVMTADEFELVGFTVGAVERDRLITGERITAGDVVLGLPSPNLRSNGFSLARRILFDIAGRDLHDAAWPDASASVIDVLLDPSVIYSPAVLAMIDAVDVRGVAHITGGGLPGNLDRVLPRDVDAVVDVTTWRRPRVFEELQRLGAVESEEMFRVFNMGIGMVLVVPPDAVDAARTVAVEQGHEAEVIGHVTSGVGQVRLRGI